MFSIGMNSFSALRKVVLPKKKKKRNLLIVALQLICIIRFIYIINNSFFHPVSRIWIPKFGWVPLILIKKRCSLTISMLWYKKSFLRQRQCLTRGCLLFENQRQHIFDYNKQCTILLVLWKHKGGFLALEYSMNMFNVQELLISIKKKYTKRFLDKND